MKIRRETSRNTWQVASPRSTGWKKTGGCAVTLCALCAACIVQYACLYFLFGIYSWMSIPLLFDCMWVKSIDFHRRSGPLLWFVTRRTKRNNYADSWNGECPPSRSPRSRFSREHELCASWFHELDPKRTNHWGERFNSYMSNVSSQTWVFSTIPLSKTTSDW